MIKTFADNMIALRKKAGLSQEQLADRIGVSRQTVSNWERGIANPDVEMLDLISKAFEVDLSTIVNGESAEQEKGKKTNLYQTVLLIAAIALMAVHFVLAFFEKIGLFPVVLIPGVLVALSVLVHFIFRHVTAQNDYSIIAGFDKKKDNIKIVKKQLATIDLLNLAIVVFFNVLFFAMYAGPREGQLVSSIFLLGAYFLTFIIIVVGVNLKIKSR